MAYIYLYDELIEGIIGSRTMTATSTLSETKYDHFKGQRVAMRSAPPQNEIPGFSGPAARIRRTLALRPYER